MHSLQLNATLIITDLLQLYQAAIVHSYAALVSASSGPGTSSTFIVEESWAQYYFKNAIIYLLIETIAMYILENLNSKKSC